MALPEVLTNISRKVGDAEGNSGAEVEEGDGHYQGNIRKPGRRLFAGLMQPPDTSQQMATRRRSRTASCSTRRGPSPPGGGGGLLTPLHGSLLFGTKW